jgi:hypothetical protein
MRCGLMRGRGLAVAVCPALLRPLIREFVTIAWTAHIVEEDTEAAMVFALMGHAVSVPRLERACMLLERGTGMMY